MNTTPSTSRNRTARFWAVRGGAVAAGVALVGGAVFGTTIMARLGLFIPRLKFLFGDWIHLIPPVQ
jgi:hypothetical protein